MPKSNYTTIFNYSNNTLLKEKFTFDNSINKSELDLGWCQGYMGLKYHMEDAYMED